MKKLSLLLSLFIVFTLEKPLKAEPGSGFGIWLGSADFSTVDKETDEKYTKGSGYSAGIDYQVALSKAFSVNFRGGETGEVAEFSNHPEIDGIKFGGLVLELDWWFGSFFIGAHAGQYVASLIESDLIYDAGSKSGRGFDMGIETERGWFFSFHSDTVSDMEISEDIKLDIASQHFDIGYRWK